jgi:surface protein
MPDFGIFRGFGSKLFSDKLYAGQLPTQLGLIGSESVIIPFEFTVKTDNAGVSTSTQFRMPLTTSTGLNINVDWGDGSALENITVHTNAIHTYATAGTYTIKVSGSLLGWQFNDGDDKRKLLNINSWGIFNASLNRAFYGCSNLTSSATDAPTITSTSLERFFQHCTIFNGDVGNWNVSNVTNLSLMFANATAFNKNIGGWDVSNVTNMFGMFLNGTSFNNGGSSSIATWNTSKVTIMSNFGLGMFQNATAFNQDIGGWNVSNVADFTNFMDGKTAANYSASNLDSIYNGWSSRSVKPNLSISFGTIKYTSASSAGRAILTGSPNNWTIIDGGI